MFSLHNDKTPSMILYIEIQKILKSYNNKSNPIKKCHHQPSHLKPQDNSSPFLRNSVQNNSNSVIYNNPTTTKACLKLYHN